MTELARWNVTVDDSAGTPLAHTPPGVFFRLAAQVIGERAAPAPLLALLKHPYAAGGRDRGQFVRLARYLERRILRGPRLAVGLGAGAALGIAGALFQRAASNPLVTPDVLGITTAAGAGTALARLSGLPPALGALAGLPWRDHLVWAATEVCYFVAVWLYLRALEDVAAALPARWYGAFLVLRLLGLSWLAVATARRALRRPAVSAVDAALRREDDDAAGPMAMRRDAVVVRYDR